MSSTSTHMTTFGLVDIASRLSPPALGRLASLFFKYTHDNIMAILET